MAEQYQVTKIHGQTEWQSDYGPMLGWQLGVRNLTRSLDGYAEINSKPNRQYTIGDTFWADIAGEHAGVPKLKRVEPPKDG